MKCPVKSNDRSDVVMIATIDGHLLQHFIRACTFVACSENLIKRYINITVTIPSE